MHGGARAIPGRSRPRWVELGDAAPLIGCAVAFALTAWLTFRGPGPRIDASMFNWSVAHRPSWILHCDEWVVCFGSPLLMAVALVLASLVVATHRRSWQPVRSSLTLLVVLSVAVLVAKNLFLRPGPAAVESTARSARAVVPGPDSPWAFPSGHATTALVTWTAGVRMILGDRVSGRARLVTPSVVTAVVSVALVTGGFHWLTDVVAAWPFAYLITRVASSITDLHPLAVLTARRTDRQRVQVQGITSAVG